MISVDKAVVARLKSKGANFEILVDPRKAFEMKKGANINIQDVLAYPAIYKDARKGEVVREEDLQKTFGTTDVYKIAEEIIKKGEFSLTTEQKRELIEEKKNQIATLISKRAINPQTNTPHPPQRILNAMEKVGKILLQLKIPPQFIGKAYSIITKAGEVKSEQYLGDGSLQVQIEIFSGVQDEFFRKIAEITKGNYESKVLKKVEV
jgi:ribosome maturation protein SDO1